MTIPILLFAVLMLQLRAGYYRARAKYWEAKCERMARLLDETLEADMRQHRASLQRPRPARSPRVFVDSLDALIAPCHFSEDA